MNDYIKNPWWVLAAGAAAGLALWGLFAGLAEFTPSLGVMVALATTGTAAGFTMAPTLGTVAACSTAAIGAALSVQLVVRITREAKKEPLIWGAPILGVLSCFLVQMCEQFWTGPKFIWLVFSVIAAFLVVIGGVLYSQKGRMVKIVGALASVVTPAATLGAVAYTQSQTVGKFVLIGDLRLWIPLILLGVVAVILAVLAQISAKTEG